LRADAAYLIGELGESKALTRLRLAAAREDSGYVVVQIESAMAKLGDQASVDKLVQYALKSDAVTIVLALQTLVELADPTTRKTLEYRLHSEADYVQTRLIAARALGRLGVEDGYELARKSLTFEADDDNETMQVRSNAALALGDIGRADALPALGRLAESEDDPRTQVAAACAICKIIRGSSGR
jgi:HEAT repeat protein